MNSLAESHPLSVDESNSVAPDPATSDLPIRHHLAFCQLALPVRAVANGSWTRDAGSFSVVIEARDPAADGSQPIPTGKYLRLLLMHLFSMALRNGAPAVEVGGSAGELATAMGLEVGGQKLRELAEQYERLLAAKITVSLNGKPAVSVFDARGRSRAAAAPEWRSSVKLNSRFYDSLVQQAVTLDRNVVAALSDSTLALDFYSWIASALPQLPAGTSLPVPWDELLARLGPANAKLEEFKTSFEQCLQQVSAACAEVALVIREGGIEIRHSDRDRRRQSRAAPAVAEPRPAPAVHPELAAEPVAPASIPVAPPPMMDAPAEPAVMASPLPPQPVVEQAQNPGHQGRRAAGDRVGLKHHITGLSQVIWLQRSNGRDDVLLEVTPGGRYDPENLTVLALEPIVVQISGGLYQRDFERVGAWANVNRDLIDDFWDGEFEDEEDVLSRVKKVPAPGWR